ncbi:MAG: diaminopimelate epimerase, partial [Bacteroidota bacterium]
KIEWQDIPCSKESDTLHIPVQNTELGQPVGVNIGNPHGVFFLEEDVERFDVHKYGPIFEHDPIFPEKANIEFANIIDRQTIRMRVWERDTGETDACGSAACGICPHSDGYRS